MGLRGQEAVCRNVLRQGWTQSCASDACSPTPLALVGVADIQVGGAIFRLVCLMFKWVCLISRWVWLTSRWVCLSGQVGVACIWLGVAYIQVGVSNIQGCATCGTPNQSSACCMASLAFSTGCLGSQLSQSGHRPEGNTVHTVSSRWAWCWCCHSNTDGS